MLYISRWKALAIVVTTLLICMFAIPNLLSPSTVQSWPKWAQRHVVLGLDLQGGSHLLLEVDTAAVRKEKVEQLRDEVRKVLREAKVGLVRRRSCAATASKCASAPADLQQGLTKLRELSQPLGGLLSATGQRTHRHRQCRRRPGAPHLDRAGDHRAHPPGGRSVDPDRDAPHRRARHRRAGDPAPGRGPDPDPGARPRRPEAT